MVETPGPVTVQEFTPVALQEMVVEFPEDTTLAGSALMVTFGGRTSTVANEGAEVPPGPLQTTW